MKRRRAALLLLLLAALLIVGGGSALVEVDATLCARPRARERRRALRRPRAQARRPTSWSSAIDDKTLGQTRTWPINRTHYAQVIEQLTEGRRGGDRPTTSSSPSRATTRRPTTRCSRPSRESPRRVVLGDHRGRRATARRTSSAAGRALKESRRDPGAARCSRADEDGALRRDARPSRRARHGRARRGAGSSSATRSSRPAATRRGSTSRARRDGPSVELRRRRERATSPRAAVRGKVAVIGVAGRSPGKSATCTARLERRAWRGPRSRRRRSPPRSRASRCTTRRTGSTWLAIVVLAALAPLRRAGAFGALVAVVVAPAALSVLYRRDRAARLQPGGDPAGRRRRWPRRSSSMVAAAVHGRARRVPPGWTGCSTGSSPSRGGNQRTRRLRALLLLSGRASRWSRHRSSLEATNALRRAGARRRSTRASTSAASRARRRTSCWSRSTTSRSTSSSEQWPFDRKYHAKVIRNAQGGRGEGDRLRRPVHRAERQRGDPTTTLDRGGPRRAGNVVLSTTEVGADGTTRVFGGGEALKYSRACRRAPTIVTDADGRIRQMQLRAGRARRRSRSRRRGVATGKPVKRRRATRPGSTSPAAPGRVRHDQLQRRARRRSSRRPPCAGRSSSSARPPVASGLPPHGHIGRRD